MNGLRKVNRLYKNPFIYSLPLMILIFLITVWPTIYTLRLSFYSTLDGINKIEFFGIKNFIRIFTDDKFYQAVFNTVSFTLMTVSVEMVLGTILALLLREINFARRLYRLIFISCLAVSPTIASLTFRQIFNPDFGIINHMLGKIGLPSDILWHTGLSTALLTVSIADWWIWTPFVMIIMYAALQMVPKEVTEAAMLDGCSSVNTFFRVEIPFIKSIVYLTIIFRVLDAFKTFDLIYVLTKGGPGRATETMVIQSFVDAFYNVDLGRAAAISVLLLIVTIFATNYAVKKIV